MAFLLPLLVRGAMVLAVVAALWGIWYKVDHWCNGACQDAQAATVEANTQIEYLHTQIRQAQERATALALLWSEAINRVEVRYVEVERNRTAAAAGIRELAGRIRPATDRVSIRVPVDALGVLDSASRLANADAPAAAEGDKGTAAPVPDASGAAETTLTDWVAFAVDAAESYREAADKHMACVNLYESARTAQGIINGQTGGSGPGHPGVGE